MESGGYTVSRIDGVFPHNPLHDLESLWWVGVWLLFCHYDPSCLLDPDVQNHIPLIAESGEKLFGLERSSRRDALVNSALLVQSNPQAFPIAAKHLFLAIFDFRKRLFTYYTSYKPGDPRDRSFFTPDIHDTCSKLFSEAIKLLKGTRDETAELWPMDRIRTRLNNLQDSQEKRLGKKPREQ